MTGLLQSPPHCFSSPLTANSRREPREPFNMQLRSCHSSTPNSPCLPPLLIQSRTPIPPTTCGIRHIPLRTSLTSPLPHNLSFSLDTHGHHSSHTDHSPPLDGVHGLAICEKQSSPRYPHLDSFGQMSLSH